MNWRKNQNLLNYKTLRISLLVVFSVILILFFAIVYSHVFSSQLNTADDAAIACAAKNLAAGNNYSTSVPFDGSYGIEKFAPAITTGPTLVLPAALLIVIFGNEFWVPGFVTASLILILLIFIINSVRKQTNIYFALTFAIVLIAFFYNITASLHFYLWFVLLGELPATFLNIFAVLLLASNPYKRKIVVLSSFLLGLAFMSKMLALLGYLPITTWFLYSIIKNQQKRKKLFIDYFYGVTAFAAPFFFFELWKLITLGFNEYIHNYYKFFKLFGKLSGTGKTNSFSIIEKFTERSSMFNEHFGFSLVLLFIVAVIFSFLIYYFSNKKFVRYSFTLLMLGAFTHLFYWVFISIGWFRYSLIGLFLYFAALSTIVFIKKPKLLIIIILLSTAALFLRPFQRLMQPIKSMEVNMFQPDRNEKNLRKTVAFLENMDANSPFVSSLWTSIVDVEYAMPGLQNFIRFDHLTEDDYNRDLILVQNTKFTKLYSYPGFEEWQKKYNDILLFAPPYLITKLNNNWSDTLKKSIIIDFSEDGNANKYITYGWSFQESGFRWTDGNSSGINFSLDYKPSDTLGININCFGYLAKAHIDYQKVSVYLNNYFVGELKITSDGSYYLVFPASDLSGKLPLRLKFEFANAHSPASFGFSSDGRKLGIGVREISVMAISSIN